jgi:hypothetical protein
VKNVPVSEGLFTVPLDFGAGVFTGDARWLEIGVRPGLSSGAYTLLSPRQALTATPYALYAQRVAEHDHLGQTWTGSDNPLVIDGSFGPPDYAPLVLSNSHAFGDGVLVNSAGDDGVSVHSAGNPSTTRSSNEHNGLEVQGAQGDGLYVGQADVHGVRVYAAGEDGVHVWSTDRDGVRVWSAGEDGVHVESAGGYAGYFGGDVHVTGAATGFFPRPTWDSGWVSISQNSWKLLEHGVGGDPDDYFVDMQCKLPPDVVLGGINNRGIGADMQSAFEAFGVLYAGLDSNWVQVHREEDDGYCPQVRMRIWLIN